MKIEKVNDHQIRCTLTREDLANRELKISELAYGTDKAKSLFHDMMQQAAYEFGFEAEDIPLMIEAVPLNSDCIVLIVTKVDDPEELDTRFSKFAPSVHEKAAEEEDDTSDEFEDDTDADGDQGSDTAGSTSLFQKLFDQNTKDGSDSLSILQKSGSAIKLSPEGNTIPQESLTRIFAFSSMSQLMSLSRILGDQLPCPNAVYKSTREDPYLLMIEQGSMSRSEFAKICNTISEYGNNLTIPQGSLSYYTEHYVPIVKTQALQTLSKI